MFESFKNICLRFVAIFTKVFESCENSLLLGLGLPYIEMFHISLYMFHIDKIFHFELFLYILI